MLTKQILRKVYFGFLKGLTNSYFKFTKSGTTLWKASVQSIVRPVTCGTVDLKTPCLFCTFTGPVFVSIMKRPPRLDVTAYLMEGT